MCRETWSARPMILSGRPNAKMENASLMLRAAPGLQREADRRSRSMRASRLRRPNGRGRRDPTASRAKEHSWYLWLSLRASRGNLARGGLRNLYECTLGRAWCIAFAMNGKKARRQPQPSIETIASRPVATSAATLHFEANPHPAPAATCRFTASGLPTVRAVFTVNPRTRRHCSTC